MPSKRKFYKTVIQVIVLSEDPLEFDEDNSVLGQLDYQVTEGDCSGQVKLMESVAVTGPAMAQLLREQNSDPSFFNLTDDGEDEEE